MYILSKEKVQKSINRNLALGRQKVVTCHTNLEKTMHVTRRTVQSFRHPVEWERDGRVIQVLVPLVVKVIGEVQDFSAPISR